MFYQVLQYGQSQYVRQCSMDAPHPTRLVELDGRILLVYHDKRELALTGCGV